MLYNSMAETSLSVNALLYRCLSEYHSTGEKLFTSGLLKLGSEWQLFKFNAGGSVGLLCGLSEAKRENFDRVRFKSTVDMNVHPTYVHNDRCRAF